MDHECMFDLTHLGFKDTSMNLHAVARAMNSFAEKKDSHE